MLVLFHKNPQYISTSKKWFMVFRSLCRIVAYTNLRSMSTKAMKPNVIFVLGGPGAGKGTQCSKIVEEFGYVHLSAGDLLREERKKPGSEVGNLIESCIREGKIVPVEITCSLLEKAMDLSGKTEFLIDGFPRNEDNMHGWQKQMGDKANVKLVLFFECPDDVCVDRCLNRGKTSGRSDDNAASLQKRLDTYHSSTKPIIDHYKEQNLVRTVNAAQEETLVFDEVKQILKS